MAVAFVPKETRPGETRVAVSPETVRRLTKGGLSVVVESGAGSAAGMLDADYESHGAKIGDASGWADADIVLKVAAPTLEEASTTPATFPVAGDPDGSDRRDPSEPSAALEDPTGWP